MKKGYYKALVVLLSCGLSSCFSNEFEEIGTKKVDGSETLCVKFFQLDEFDHISPIRFDLLNQNDSILINRKYVTGETPLMQSVEKFSPILYDSILYICYPYPEVCAIHHLDPSKPELSRDTLFRIIKAHDSALIDVKQK